ncbi:MAG: hypothetical protein AB7P08_10370 [Burkholderiales bacterium]
MTRPPDSNSNAADALRLARKLRTEVDKLQSEVSGMRSQIVGVIDMYTDVSASLCIVCDGLTLKLDPAARLEIAQALQRAADGLGKRPFMRDTVALVATQLRDAAKGSQELPHATDGGGHGR